MDGQISNFRYRLGIDVGVASLGIAILQLKKDIDADTGENRYDIYGGAVRTYPIPEGAEERRSKRGMRRNIERRERRLDRLSDLLSRNGIGYPRKEMPKELLNLSPIKLRAMASREKVELAHLARALLHMARHRGSSAIRESGIKEEGKDKRQTAQGIESLRQEMKRLGFETYGQYLRWREKQPKTLPIRINQQKMADSKDGYAYYPSRQMLREEFKTIWDKQVKFHSETLTEELKKEVEKELFFQRAVTAPPPGKCPYFLEEDRLPKTSRLFQIRRIYENVNHLRFYDKAGRLVDYDLKQRDLIVAKLMAGEDITLARVKETIGLKRTDKASIEDEDGKSSKEIAGYPFDRALGADDVLGRQWTELGLDRQDDILHILASVHDDDLAAEALQKALDCDNETARNILQTPLPSGHGRMGPTATAKILEELKKDVVPARIAQDRAKLVHAAAPDGVVHSLLPYYGEILVGHTAPPMWVSDYRRETDTPPNTSENESRFGRIPNPVVHLALNQIRRTVNAVIRRHGIPESIHIELARELNKSAEARDKIAKDNRDRGKDRKKIIEMLNRRGISSGRKNIQRYQMWRQQKGVCIYTGENISETDLFGGNIDVDHILPRGKTFSDAMANKIVCLKSANADKGDRAPFDAFADNENYDWDGIKRRVEKLPNNKKWRFKADAMEAFKDQEAFRARYGTDNSYIARVTAQYLSCLYGEPSKIIAVSSYIVGLLRAKWGLQNILGSRKDGRKARDDHRHHFIDALVAACATRSMVQRIQREAARCEKEGLEDFVERIIPPFGNSKAFFNAAREATLNRVTLSRKADHSTAGQLHQDLLFGIVDPAPDKDGKYVCRKRKKLEDYKKLEDFEKPKIANTLPDLEEIKKARIELERLKSSLRNFAQQAESELEAERQADIDLGKKGRAVTPNAIFSRAVKLHKESGGKMAFVLFEKQKLVNIRRAFGGNRPTGGYVGGRNHRKDFYLDSKGKLQWQLISMLQANDRNFVRESEKPGRRLLWSAHKEDVLLMDNPENPHERIRVVVAKFGEAKMGVVPEYDAREAKQRVMWENGLRFFRKLGVQRIVTDSMGKITWHFPALPKSGKIEPEK